jgi:hypothetical protein
MLCLSVCAAPSVERLVVILVPVSGPQGAARITTCSSLDLDDISTVVRQHGRGLCAVAQQSGVSRQFSQDTIEDAGAGRPPAGRLDVGPARGRHSCTQQKESSASRGPFWYWVKSSTLTPLRGPVAILCLRTATTTRTRVATPRARISSHFAPACWIWLPTRLSLRVFASTSVLLRARWRSPAAVTARRWPTTA